MTAEKGKQGSADAEIMLEPFKPDAVTEKPVKNKRNRPKSQPGITIEEAAEALAENVKTIAAAGIKPDHNTADAEKIENCPPDVQANCSPASTFPDNIPKPAGNETQPPELPAAHESDNRAETAGKDGGPAIPSPTIPATKERRAPTIRQAAYLRALLDPASPTYGNQTASYKSVYGKELADTTAAANGCRVLRGAKDHGWIDDILARAGATVEDRVSDLAAIASNRTSPRKVKRQVLTKEGEIITLIDEYEPSHSERVKAHDLINKLSGDYDVSRHNNRIAESEYKALLKHSLGRVKGSTKHERNVTGGDGELSEEKGRGEGD